MMKKFFTQLSFDTIYWAFMIIAITTISLWAIDTKIIIPKETKKSFAVISDKYIEDFWNRDEYTLIVDLNEIFYKERVTVNIYYSVEIGDAVNFIDTQSPIFKTPSHHIELP